MHRAHGTPRELASEFRWQRTNAPPASSRTDDIWFLGADRGWAVNSNGHILHTRDGGVTWVRKFSATGTYLGCVGFADEQRGWVGTLAVSRRLFRTLDGGSTWGLVPNLPREAPPAICGLSVVNERVLYASGTNFPDRPTGVIKSTDGGETWIGWDMREHALMVQYLYAAYSLKSSDEVIDPAQQAALDDLAWPAVLFGIAREEMGHLMTVQNMLLLLGLPPNFEREDFPPRKELYPFSLHLERLLQKSLAKYVVAEAPFDATDIDDIIQLAQESTGAAITHVGVLYGLLGLVFATAREVQSGGSGSTSWDEMVRHISEAAYQQAPANVWHLPDDAFHPLVAAQQADPADWQVGNLRVHRMADRTAARSAIRDIGEQGEGPTNEGVQSHFDRFRGIYRGQQGLSAFPAAGEWLPTRDVPTNPRVGIDITDPRAKRWAELADIRYALLLGLIEHYLQTSGGDRSILMGWIFAEMRSRVGFIARKLTTMPRGGADGVAAAPFMLPNLLHLPGAETARWGVHRQRTEAAITKVEEIQAADAADEADPYLSDLLASDRARLAFIAGRTTAPGVTTSFARDILPLFRPMDIEHMRDIGVDLSQHDVVREAAQVIRERVQGTGGRIMPPAPGQPWTKAQIDLFAQWIADGFPA